MIFCNIRRSSNLVSASALREHKHGPKPQLYIVPRRKAPADTAARGVREDAVHERNGEGKRQYLVLWQEVAVSSFVEYRRFQFYYIFLPATSMSPRIKF